ncbi:NUDIX hydrolase [Agrobacterium sp. rho-13.3]|uniref:NUDIX hydrolase n=1 Tax=Agrobacterium sp. rho-13.3 TaxID=3072980 RepID=UPI002A119F3C|nr:NUDIX domain-containing protein [Agrobacterium sp. rho-13.3]MDX8311769.1 NUDIX domain-containing protein [Agrobacterium sp. rho-13.3]
MRPKDAASILLIDRSMDRLRVLVGKRSSAHVFMPDLYVFPGGRRDPRDHALPFGADLHPAVMDNLIRSAARPLTAAGARALALAAIRELHEETGLRFGNDARQQERPDLSKLRFVARAITPPGKVRRFDTRFFCCFTDEVGINPAVLNDSRELLDLQWLDIQGNSSLNMAPITRLVLEDVTKFMIGDPSLQFESPVRQYFERRGKFIRGFL